MRQLSRTKSSALYSNGWTKMIDIHQGCFTDEDSTDEGSIFFWYALAGWEVILLLGKNLMSLPVVRMSTLVTHIAEVNMMTVYRISPLSIVFSESEDTIVAIKCIILMLRAYLNLCSGTRLTSE
ncbi:hypothetical protein Tco_0813668 [Tanacetum coccineum]